jgi:nitrogen PTS system EIIA component
MNKTVSLGDLLGPSAVLDDLEVADKKQLMQTLSRHVSEQLDMEEHLLFDVLWEREKLGTTGVGHGIAIPHGRVAGIEKVQGTFVRLNTPIDFDSVDNHPVDLVFLLLAPEAAGADHLHALAAVSRAFRDATLCEALRKAKNIDVLTRLLSKATTAEAA